MTAPDARAIIAELEPLIEAATPAPWSYTELANTASTVCNEDGPLLYVAEDAKGDLWASFYEIDDGKYVAAANPANLRILIDALKTEWEENAQLQDEVGPYKIRNLALLTEIEALQRQIDDALQVAEGPSTLQELAGYAFAAGMRERDTAAKLAEANRLIKSLCRSRPLVASVRAARAFLDQSKEPT